MKLNREKLLQLLQSNFSYVKINKHSFSVFFYQLGPFGETVRFIPLINNKTKIVIYAFGVSGIFQINNINNIYDAVQELVKRHDNKPLFKENNIEDK